MQDSLHTPSGSSDQVLVERRVILAQPLWQQEQESKLNSCRRGCIGIPGMSWEFRDSCGLGISHQNNWPGNPTIVFRSKAR